MNIKLRPILVFVMLAIAAIAVFGNRAALATGKKPPDPVSQEQEQEQGQHQGQAQGQYQDASASAEQRSYTDSSASAGSNAVGEGGAANNEGIDVANNTSTTNNHSSSFLALGLTFPSSTDDCGRGVQGGGQDDSKSAFLGFTWLDKNCRAQRMAAGSVDPAENAQLRCADKVFRNAVTSDLRNSKRLRTAECIARTTAKNRMYMKAANAQLAEVTKLQAENSRLRQQKRDCLIESNAKHDELSHCYSKLDDSTK